MTPEEELKKRRLRARLMKYVREEIGSTSDTKLPTKAVERIVEDIMRIVREVT